VNGVGDLWVFHADGSVASTAGLGGQAHYAQFSSDGAVLAVALDAGIQLLDPLSPAAKPSLITLPRKSAREIPDRVDGFFGGEDLITEIITGLAFSPSSKQLVATSVSGAVFIIPLDDPDQIVVHRDLHRGGSTGVAFAPDGDTFVTADADGSNVVWDAASGEPLALRLPPSGGAEAVTYTLGSDIIITGGKDGSIRLWNAATGRILGAPLKGHAGEVVALAASSSGRLFATGSRDGSVRLWDVFDPQRACTLAASVVTLEQAEASLTTPVTICADALAD